MKEKLMEISQTLSYFLLTSVANPYFSFNLLCSWLPRLRWTLVGYNNLKEHKINKTSVPFSPLSTKSPLNIYALASDGNPIRNYI